MKWRGTGHAASQLAKRAKRAAPCAHCLAAVNVRPLQPPRSFATVDEAIRWYLHEAERIEKMRARCQVGRSGVDDAPQPGGGS